MYLLNLISLFFHRSMQKHDKDFVNKFFLYNILSFTFAHFCEIIRAVRFFKFRPVEFKSENKIFTLDEMDKFRLFLAIRLVLQLPTMMLSLLLWL